MCADEKKFDQSSSDITPDLSDIKEDTNVILERLYKLEIRVTSTEKDLAKLELLRTP